MNRSRIDWCDDTWNPITGCKHNCPYCYARTMSARFSGNIRLNLMDEQCKREGSNLVLDNKFVSETEGVLAYPFGFEPTFHRYRFGELGTPGGRKSGSKIFIGSMADIFGEWIPDEWIEMIFSECKNYDRHKYLFLTKNPYRYTELDDAGKLPLQDNIWYGSTITKNDELYFGGTNTFLSVEPILDDITMISDLDYRVTDWIIIGAETGNTKGKVIPKLSWINNIVDYCDRFNIPVFMKKSLEDILGKENMRCEYPEKLRMGTRSEKVAERLEASCGECETHMDKSKMIAIHARSVRGEMPKMTVHICRDCFRELCKQWDVPLPELKVFKDEKL